MAGGGLVNWDCSRAPLVGASSHCKFSGRFLNSSMPLHCELSVLLLLHRGSLTARSPVHTQCCVHGQFTSSRKRRWTLLMPATAIQTVSETGRRDLLQVPTAVCACCDPHIAPIPTHIHSGNRMIEDGDLYLLMASVCVESYG